MATPSATAMRRPQALMAPEGYVIEALTRALGDNLSRQAVRAQVVRSYASWQRISVGSAGRVFAEIR